MKYLSLFSIFVLMFTLITAVVAGDEEENWQKFSKKSKQTLAKLGLDELMWAYKTPYEKLMFERMSKQMQRGPGVAFAELDKFLKSKAGVPGT